MGAGKQADALEGISFKEVQEKELAAIQKLHADKTADNLVGLAFSGGGIRSATFGLGVLEALKQFGLLKKIDYLSTVSGGGYIGAWLSANCKRSADRIEQQSSTEAGWLEPEADWEESIKHLRRHSNYLSPNLSLLNADTWSMATIWLRNTLLVQLMIFISIACLLLVPRILFSIFTENAHNPEWNYATIILFLIAAAGITLNLLNLVNSFSIYKPFGVLFSQLAVQVTSALPLMLVSLGYTGILWEKVNPWKEQSTRFSYGDILVSIKNDFLDLLEYAETSYFLNNPGFLLEKNTILITILIITYLAFSIHSYISINSGNSRLRKTLISVFAPMPALALFIAILSAIMLFFNAWTILPDDNIEARWLAFVWGSPAVLCAFSLAVNLLIGMLGRDTSEQVREWWSRFGAWLAIYAFGLPGVFHRGRLRPPMERNALLRRRLERIRHRLDWNDACRIICREIRRHRWNRRQRSQHKNQGSGGKSDAIRVHRRTTDCSVHGAASGCRHQFR